jgi:ubiquitin-conjugating enzyme E2 G1
MLSEPNIESPANIDAGKQCRDNPEEYKKKVRYLVNKSMDDF